MCRETENIKGVNTISTNCDEAFELTGHGWYNRMVLIACCVVTNAVALDMFGFSIVVAAARCDLAMGLQETGLLASAPFTGVLFAFPWGYYADVYGRRRALLLSTSGGFLFAALSSFATSWKVMMGLKIVGCCFSTSGFTLTMTYLGECSGRIRRSRYQFYLNSMNVASELITFGLAFFILPLPLKVSLPWLSMTYRSWRLYTLILAFPLGLGAMMLLFLHESPKFVANIGQTDKALEIMKSIHRINGGKKNDYPVQSLMKVDAKTVTSFWNSIVKQTVPLFKPPLLWRTLQLAFLMAVCSATSNAFLMWFPSVVNIFFISLSSGNKSDSGFCQQINNNATLTTVTPDTGIVSCDDTIALNAIYSGIILGVFVVVLNLCVSTIASYRRLVLTSVLLLASISCILVGSLKHPLASLMFFSLIQCTPIGLGSIASYFVDLYPTSYRGLVTSLSAMIARLSSFTGVIAVGYVIIDYCSPTFYIWAVLNLCAVGVSLLLPSDRRSNIDM